MQIWSGVPEKGPGMTTLERRGIPFPHLAQRVEVWEKVYSGQSGWSGSVIWDDPGLCESHEAKGLEGGASQNGLNFLDCRLAIPESPSHIKVCVC